MSSFLSYFLSFIFYCVVWISEACLPSMFHGAHNAPRECGRECPESTRSWQGGRHWEGAGGKCTLTQEWSALITLPLILLSPTRARELCESRGCRPWLPVLNSPYGFCGRKATLNETSRATSVKTVVRGKSSPPPTPPTPSLLFSPAILYPTQDCFADCP